MIGEYVIVIRGKNVYWTHGDRQHMYLLGGFDNWRGALHCAEGWAARTGRTIVRLTD